MWMTALLLGALQHKNAQMSLGRAMKQVSIRLYAETLPAATLRHAPNGISEALVNARDHRLETRRQA